MSVKFERDTIQTLQDATSNALQPFQSVTADNGPIVQRSIKTVTEKTVDAAAQQAAERAAALAEGPGPIRRAFEGAAPLPGTSGKHPLAETIGTALTGGKAMAGTKGYLAVCFFDPGAQIERGRMEEEEKPPEVGSRFEIRFG